MDNFEKIGKVTLDLSFYKGTDVYSDGDIEDEILDIVKNNEGPDYSKVIEERLSWPILYHLSDKRENIVEWLDITKEHKVLEVGSGCGAITGVISRKAGSVTCVDLSRRRSLINASRHKDCENITIAVGNFNDIEPSLPSDYDYIMLIGVFEYGMCYIPGDSPFTTFLKIIKKHLKPGGRVVIAIENRLGLKYFAGFREDHLGTFFSGIENYDDTSSVRTFSRPALERLFKEAGFEESHFFYPYPDYKFPFSIYSDERPPKAGELNCNDFNPDRDRLSLFDETKAVNSIADDGLFSVFSNSYLAVLGPRPSADYARFCINRCEKYAIRTTICGGDRPSVIKTPIAAEASDHIRKLAESCEKLSMRYTGSSISVAPVRILEGDLPAAEFEFMPGRTLESEFDEMVQKGDREGFKALFHKYVGRIGYNKSFAYSDTDLVFSNILDNDDTWYLIDYEWAAPVRTDPERIGLRALWCYMLERDFRCFEGMDFLKEVTGAGDREIEAFREKEKEFQAEVTAGRYSVEQIKTLIGNGKLNFKDLALDLMKEQREWYPQLYFDRGAGFSEPDSLFVKDAYHLGDTIRFDAEFTGDVVNLRLDPTMEPCFVYLDEVLINGNAFAFSKHTAEANGRSLKGSVTGYYFGTEDPNIVLHLAKIGLKPVNRLHVSFRYSPVPESMAADILPNIKRIF